ncbi:Cytochrome c6 [Hyella patelloides LEGE 07179]|uniref:Cytochrome c6 n=1 Tax=Hyella patelloides LEGE 07179 TaxID=945734 RepID=A0A563VYL0_9CYAN|nr:c-type cytochrome [Hyella patelloides]VEP16511.1 Cytochrome c6 [Hyella patelloides LEGE 07179]
MFKRLLALAFAIVTVVSFSFASPAFAGDAANGGKIFGANCAACHMGGNNVVNAVKTLKQDALKQYDMYSLDAIKYQVTNGKNAMPAFGSKLSEAQIEDVATYVLSQADSGW